MAEVPIVLKHQGTSLGRFDGGLLRRSSPWFAGYFDRWASDRPDVIELNAPEHFCLACVREVFDALAPIGEKMELRATSLSFAYVGQALEFANFLMLKFSPESFSNKVKTASQMRSDWQALLTGLPAELCGPYTILGEAVADVIVADIVERVDLPWYDRYWVSLAALRYAPWTLLKTIPTRIQQPVAVAKWSVLQRWNDLKQDDSSFLPLQELEIWQDECLKLLLKDFATTFDWTTWGTPTSQPCAINLASIPDDVVSQIKSVAQELPGQFICLNPHQACRFEGVSSVIKSCSDAFDAFPFLENLQLEWFAECHPKFSKLVFKAVVAGGAISNLYHGQGCGDVDIFFICMENQNYEAGPDTFYLLWSCFCRAELHDDTMFSHLCDSIEVWGWPSSWSSWNYDMFVAAGLQDWMTRLLTYEQRIRNTPLSAQFEVGPNLFYPMSWRCEPKKKMFGDSWPLAKELRLRSCMEQLIRSIVTKVSVGRTYVVADCDVAYSLIISAPDGKDTPLHIQLINYMYSSIDALLVTFDIAAIQCCFDGKTFFGTPQFLRSIATGDIIVGGPKRPSAAAYRYPRRLAKYARRGFGLFQPLHKSSSSTPEDFLALYEQSERDDIQAFQRVMKVFATMGVSTDSFSPSIRYRGLALLLHLNARAVEDQSDTGQTREKDAFYDSQGLRMTTADLCCRLAEFQSGTGIVLLHDHEPGNDESFFRQVADWVKMLRNGRTRVSRVSGYFDLDGSLHNKTRLNVMAMNYAIRPGHAQLSESVFWQHWNCQAFNRCWHSAVRHYDGTIESWLDGRPLNNIHSRVTLDVQEIGEAIRAVAAYFPGIDSRQDRNLIAVFFPSVAQVVYAEISPKCVQNFKPYPSTYPQRAPSFSEILSSDADRLQYTPSVTANTEIDPGYCSADDDGSMRHGATSCRHDCHADNGSCPDMPTGAKEGDPEADAKISEEDALRQETDDVLNAVLRSKADAAPRSADGAVVLRLTRTSGDIMQTLSESTHLQGCRTRVLEAGCELLPEWANGALLLIPLTMLQVAEDGLQLAPHNIVALASDQEVICHALREIPNKKRPKLKPEHQADASFNEHVESEHIGFPSGMCRGPAGSSHIASAAIVPETELDEFEVRLEVMHTFIHFRDPDESLLGGARSAPF